MTIQSNSKNTNNISRRGLLLGAGGAVAAGLLNTIPPCGAAEPSEQPPNDAEKTMPLQVFCGTGDHLWGHHLEPVDSPATIGAMLEWMAATYQVSRLYWRGGQSMMWDEHFRMGSEKLTAHDWTAWKHHLYQDVKINEATVAAAHKQGMECFMYTGLFESGVQPDIGVVGPHPFEDEIRIAHPEWCPVDRWGQRRCPGPISFCYPEARKLLIKRYMDNIERFGYDGINFYTYVENCGILYEDEFGFNQPIVDEFNKKYPDVDLRSATLTAEHKEHWYACRGKFVTDFLRELQAELSKRGKKLSIIVDAENPDNVQPWWSQSIPGSGNIKMDWRTWVREGIVQELWVQLGPSEAQHSTIELLQDECNEHGVELTVRAIDPFASGWKPYIKKDLTPIACITWKRNGIERVSLESIDGDSLDSTDWKQRLQALLDVEAGTLKAAPKKIASLAKDPQVLVRRRVMYALAALKAESQVSTLEEGLLDVESSVRIAAASALAVVHGPHSAVRILSALEKDGYFQMKLACFEGLTALGEEALAPVLKGARSTHYAVRQVSIQTLYKLGKGGFMAEAAPALFDAAVNHTEDELLRSYALEGMVGFREEITPAFRIQLVDKMIELASEDPSTLVQLRAAWGLGYFYSGTDATKRKVIVDCLATGFRNYGDGCQRSDAAYGWRIFGNSLLMHHGQGRTQLESMRTQGNDKWLAWVAYEVVYLPHRQMKMALLDEQEMIEQHNKFAPEFPGYRTW